MRLILTAFYIPIFYILLCSSFILWVYGLPTDKHCYVFCFLTCQKTKNK
ncbi:hypothetical protein NTHI1209_00371 [Haemophilus influenzae]|uniref:Uncharacterized protein n=1 Tax=Haemophilus influenzae TaxID=727 RepID=A0A158SV75_HAEIF|nr:hypothetical protein NTHI1209_00371 [Haemophilus influenzae]